MKQLNKTKYVHEGRYVAEVDVQLIDDPDPTTGGWSPYLSLEDATRLDNVRSALRQGDINAATKLARIYQLTPLTPR